MRTPTCRRLADGTLCESLPSSQPTRRAHPVFTAVTTVALRCHSGG
jgi:hypothetical protein